MTSPRETYIHVPVLARVEGEGALRVHIRDGCIKELGLDIYEPPRLFEKLLEGRNPQDVLDMIARICGICPVAYQLTAVQAMESAFGVTPSPWTCAMRRVMYCGEWLQSHSLHVHLLALPDFLGYDNVVAMAQQHGELVRRGLSLQTLGNDLIALFGARSVHPVGVCPGGFHHAPATATLLAMADRLSAALPLAEALLREVALLPMPDDHQPVVCVSLRHPDTYPIQAGSLLTSDGLALSIDLWDEHFVEQQVPHSTALHATLNGEPYLVGPLARMNLNQDRLPARLTTLLKERGIGFPSDNMFHSLRARVAEMWLALHDAAALLREYGGEQANRIAVTPRAGVGYGCTEAPRGVLWQRYEFDAQGRVISARIVPPTSQNQARIEEDLRASLEHLGLEKDDATLRKHSETVIRNYDPCISCATHFLQLKVSRDESSSSR